MNPRLHKFISWVTSSGHADFYIVGAPDPDYVATTAREQLEVESKTASFLVFRHEIRSSSEGYRAMGMHGNHAGPAFCETILSDERILSRFRNRSADERPGGDDFTPMFQLFQAAVHVGIMGGALDLARAHVLTRIHADSGHKVAEYPIVQVKFVPQFSLLHYCYFFEIY